MKVPPTGLPRCALTCALAGRGTVAMFEPKCTCVLAFFQLAPLIVLQQLASAASPVVIKGIEGMEAAAELPEAVQVFITQWDLLLLHSAPAHSNCH